MKFYRIASATQDQSLFWFLNFTIANTLCLTEIFHVQIVNVFICVQSNIIYIYFNHPKGNKKELAKYFFYRFRTIGVVKVLSNIELFVLQN